jgi:hypothetical protein
LFWRRKQEFIVLIDCQRTIWTIARVGLGAENPIPKGGLRQFQVTDTLPIVADANLAEAYCLGFESGSE